MTLHYLAYTADGRALATSLLVSDPTTTPDTIDVAAESQSHDGLKAAPFGC
ncbi:hypothetical protein [Nocardia brasiliensis]|uniref:hypothetical protein n=1 Tax=Nocardia brasiliensis TaxID=37326 RepID=UPI0024563D47|nr:hypothetical protein [Nocardia brasiliensis]